MFQYEPPVLASYVSMLYVPTIWASYYRIIMDEDREQIKLWNSVWERLMIKSIRHWFIWNTSMSYNVCKFKCNRPKTVLINFRQWVNKRSDTVNRHLTLALFIITTYTICSVGWTLYGMIWFDLISTIYFLYLCICIDSFTVLLILKHTL